MGAPSKANYKTYEAQARMVRAIVAAHPDVKWNYKEIAACYGSDMTEHALNHRFRKIRAHSVIIEEARSRGLDMKDLTADEKALPATQESVDKKNIAKYFGQSTADGIQFQFRTIKKDADLLRQTANEGGDVANCLSVGGGSTVTTPSKPTLSRRGGGSRSGAGSKRSRKQSIKISSSDDEDDDMDEMDFEAWEAQDDTPSKRTKTGPTQAQKAATPSRRAAAKARDTIADASARLQSSESPPEIATPTVAAPSAAFVRPASVFGEPEHKPSQTELDSYRSPFNQCSSDPFLNDSFAFTNASFYSEMDNDGEC